MKSLIEKEPEISIRYDYLSQCYLKSNNIQLASKWEEKATEVKMKYSISTAIKNYYKLAHILKKENVLMTFIQYPNRDVDVLKNMLRDSPYFEDILFVDNKEVFQREIEKNGFDYIFSDAFAGDFGHATDYGNKLLGQNVGKQIVENMNWPTI